MIRLGFILGFLAGGGFAAFLAQLGAEDAEEPNPVLAGLKQQVEQAREAGQEAKQEKEAEMIRLHDDLVHRRVPPAQIPPY